MKEELARNNHMEREHFIELLSRLEGFRNEKTARSFQKHENRESKMYCSIHKSTTHNTKDCRDSGKKKTPGEDLNIITEKKRVFDEPTINGKIEGKVVEILLDTGAKRNYVSRKIYEKLKLKEEKCKRKRKFVWLMVR